MSARHLFKPYPQFTGRCQFQPRVVDSSSGWYIDWHGNFNDAPDRLASGSVRAVDVGDLCLMVANVDRPGSVA
jgi:hypothetical protein